MSLTNIQLFKQPCARLRARFKDWFYWDPGHVIRSYFNVPEMPQLRLSYGSPARAYLLEAARKLVGAWGWMGYRLDYASGPEQDFSG